MGSLGSCLGELGELGTGQAIFQIIMHLESKFASLLPLQQHFCLEKITYKNRITALDIFDRFSYRKTKY